MQVANLVSELDEMVGKGQILESIEKFFAPEVVTIEVGGAKTSTRDEKVGNLQGFLGSIKTVNGITIHNTASGEDVSLSECTFDFDMQDGSKILWHEVIRRSWKDGKVVEEQYFQN